MPAMSPALRRCASLGAALCLAAPRPAHAGEPTTCPSVAPQHGDDDRWAACLEDAAKAGDPAQKAALIAEALTYATRAYTAGRAAADRGWLLGAGAETVHYSTLECERAGALAPEQARAMLTACVQLLEMHLGDLTRDGSTDTPEAREDGQRLAELRPLLERLTPAEAPEPAPAVDVQTAAPPVDARPRPPRGLYAGVGVGAGLAVVSAVGLGVSWSYGQRAYARIEPPERVAPGDVGKSVCAVAPAPDGCDDHARARRLVVASAVGLGLSLAATLVFTTLLVRHRRAAARVAAIGPGGVALRF